jgi:hypothetical protein
MVVKDVYLDCFHFEESPLAHYIHHLLAEKKISLDDDIFKIDLNQADHKKVAEMVQKNVLGFYKVLHLLIENEPKGFCLYLCSQPARGNPILYRNVSSTPIELS